MLWAYLLDAAEIELIEARRERADDWQLLIETYRAVTVARTGVRGRG